MINRDSMTDFFTERSYAIGAGLVSRESVETIVGALGLVGEETAVHYRLDAAQRFEWFQGSMPLLANDFMGRRQVAIRLVSENPIPHELSTRFFSKLEERFGAPVDPFD